MSVAGVASLKDSQSVIQSEQREIERGKRKKIVPLSLIILLNSCDPDIFVETNLCVLVCVLNKKGNTTK